jgi:hypothetical protein
MKALKVSEFPAERDEVTACWWPIQMEPIPASGERLTIGVVVASESGVLVQPTPGLDKLRFVFGEEAHVIEHSARITVSALEEHLRKRGGAKSIGDFVPPFASIHLGSARSASGDNLEGIVHQAIALSSSIAEISQRSIAGEERSRHLGSKALTESVRQIVVSQLPQLSDSFNVPLRGIASRRVPVLGFVSREIVSNFSPIGPTRVNQSIEKVRTGMWALDLHRTLNPDFSPGIYRMYLHRLRAEDKLLQTKQLKDINEACAEIAYEGSKKDITIDIQESLQGIAKDLLSRVKAYRPTLV